VTDNKRPAWIFRWSAFFCDAAASASNASAFANKRFLVTKQLAT
jgi:hypothetical protein